MGLFGKKREENKSCCCNGASAPAETASSVKVLGSGCAKCHALADVARAALEELGMDTAIEPVTDFSQIAAYGVISTPALAVDGKVVSYGNVLSKEEAKDIFLRVRA